MKNGDVAHFEQQECWIRRIAAHFRVISTVSAYKHLFLCIDMLILYLRTFANPLYTLFSFCASYIASLKFAAKSAFDR